MRPWADPHHHRGGLLGGAAFPLRIARLFSLYLNEFFEPVMSFFLDIMTALILGFFFVIQSISVLLSLDTIVVAMIKSIQGLLYSILSYTMAIFTLEDSDKRTIGYSFIDFATNLLWAAMVSPASVSGHVKEIFFIMPCVAFATVHCLSSVLANKVELHPENIMYASLLTTVIFGQSLMFVAILSKIAPLQFFNVPSPENIATLSKNKEDIFGLFFVLKANIDIFFHGAGTLCKYFARDHLNNMENNPNHAPNSLAWILDGHDPLDIPQYLESSRQTLWLVLTFHQFIVLRQTLRRQDLWFFYCVLFHLFAKLIAQFRAISKRLQVKRTIAKRFHRITNQELLRLQAEGERCAICLNEHNIRESMRIPCQHVFHVACLTRVLQATPPGQASRCPICRADIHTHTHTHDNPSNSSHNRTAATANINGNSLNNLQNNMSFLRVRIVHNNNATLPPVANAGVASSLAEALERSRINVHSSSNIISNSGNHTVPNPTGHSMNNATTSSSSSSSDVGRILVRNADGQSFSIDRSAMVAAIREHYQQQQSHQQQQEPQQRTSASTADTSAQPLENEETEESLDDVMDEDDGLDESSESSEIDADEGDDGMSEEESAAEEVWIKDDDVDQISRDIVVEEESAKKGSTKVDTALMVLDDEDNSNDDDHNDKDGNSTVDEYAAFSVRRRGMKRTFDALDSSSAVVDTAASVPIDTALSPISTNVVSVPFQESVEVLVQPSLEEDVREEPEAETLGVKRQRR